MHRYCIWHILNKFTNKLGALNYCNKYQFFKSVILNYGTGEKFETSWLDLLQGTKLQDNAWLCQLYDICSKWVLAFVNKCFSAGMSSSQRAESSHSFLKKYISRINSLMNFITLFNRALGHQWHELVANHKDINDQPKVPSLWPMETQMVKIYTKTIFLSF